jgi:serine/threonine protein kinase
MSTTAHLKQVGASDREVTLWDPAGFTRKREIENCEGCIVIVYADSSGDEKCVVKLLRPKANSVKGRELVLKVIRDAEKLIHPCILHVMAVSEIAPGQGPGVVMDLMSCGSLEDLLKRACPEREDRTRQTKILVGILLALLYLHNKGRIHGGVKPSNVFVDDEGNPKLGDIVDFELCNKGCMAFKQTSRMTYAAPEKKDAKASNKIDVFSWALVAVHVFTMNELSVTMSARVFKFNKSIPGLDARVAKLINQCLSQDPTQRPTVDLILRDLKAIDYQIFPGVNSEVIQEFVTASSAET